MFMGMVYYFFGKYRMIPALIRHFSENFDGKTKPRASADTEMALDAFPGL